MLALPYTPTTYADHTDKLYIPPPPPLPKNDLYLLNPSSL